MNSKPNFSPIHSQTEVKKYLPSPLKGSAAKNACILDGCIRKDQFDVDLGIWRN